MGCAFGHQPEPGTVTAEFARWAPQIHSVPEICAEVVFRNTGGATCRVVSHRIQWEGGERTFTTPIIDLPPRSVRQTRRCLDVGVPPAGDASVFLLEVRCR
jgi:hypothetical protein